MALGSTRAGKHPNPPTTPRASLLGRLLDPIDRLAETIYSILILLTFTLAFRLIKLGPDVEYAASPDSYINELLIGALGAIDEITYALLAVLARGESHRLLHNIQAAGDHSSYCLSPAISGVATPAAAPGKPGCCSLPSARSCC